MRRLMLAIFIVLTLGPVAALVVAGLAAPGGAAGDFALSGRHWRLLAETLWLALCVSAGATVVGTLAAGWLGMRRRGPAAWL